MTARSRHSVSAFGSETSRGGVIPRGTAVEVFDEGRWHKGGKITGFSYETEDYVIVWDGCNETTTAGRHEVRREVTDWKRVKHDGAFQVDAKKAPYENWLDQQAAPVVSEKKRKHKTEEKDIDAAPWVAPHKDPVLPEWQSALGSLPAKKKQATWEKRVRKSLKKSVVADRPDFSVPKKVTVPEWVSESSEPPKKNYEKRLQKYWGRFAPEDAFKGEDEDAAASSERRVRKVRRRKLPPVAADEAADDEEHDDHEPQQEEAEAAAAAEAAEDAAAEYSDREGEEEVEEHQEEVSGDAPAAQEEEEGRSDEVGLLLEDSEAGDDARARVFAQLSGEADSISEEVLVAEICGVLGIEHEQYHDGVPLALAASDSAASIAPPSFHRFLVCMHRYHQLKSLYIHEDADLTKPVEPEHFEKAIPLLSSWGLGMSDIEEAFLTESRMEEVCRSTAQLDTRVTIDTHTQITFEDFLGWAVRHSK